MIALPMAIRFSHSIVVILATLPMPLAAQVVYVDAAASAGGNGQTWATAFTNLQQALSSASAGQSVWVTAGTYPGNFTIPADVQLLGGFAGRERRADQARPFANMTSLDGGGIQRVVDLGNGSTLDGFFVQNGNAPSPGGGGALVNGVTATIRRCVFTANRNSGGRGAALAVVAGDPLVEDCLFHHNDNTGHTIDIDLAGLGTFDHITVVDNPHNGSPMQNGSTCRIENSIFAYNQGRGICDFLAGPANQPTLRNCLFWQNTISLIHVQGTELHSVAAVNALAYASGNVAADPFFASSTDYRLTPGSGAMDVALAEIETRLDLGGMPRTTDGDLNGTMIADIGAYEFNNCGLAAIGPATPGSSLLLNVNASGFGGIAMLLPGPATTVAPFGIVYGTSPIAAILGFLPGSLTVNIPAGLDTDIVFQGFCFSPTSNGNLSNPLAFAIY